MNKKSIPFLILAILHSIILLITFRKKGKKTFTLLTIGIGVAYVFEYFVLNVFKMYKYYPKIFKNKWIDSVMGALLSQAVFVPITGTVLTLFKHGWKARIGAALFYGATERIFIKWKIFSNDTWSTIYTVGAMPMYFYIITKWWRGLQNGNKLIQWSSLLLCFWTNYTNILFIALARYKKYRFRFHAVRNRYWDHFIIVPLYTLLASIVGTINTFHMPTSFKWCGILFMHLIDQCLFHCKLIKPSNKGSLYKLLPIHISILLLGEIYKKLIKSEHHIHEVNTSRGWDKTKTRL
ncbi:hypothetical protein [Bacillus suaedaesalsae]|uniref:Uncharacterized protein n=1 Tax=Bacillus suaedaesalsae TaxID=2810349 RepID=A0ABS2DM68_9BACI|nr:hypothetical protein [Bacillus suaedaesalsae]MBM6619599.1 hypothetical protein [Bacillus suaedaesalsae]